MEETMDLNSNSELIAKNSFHAVELCGEAFSDYKNGKPFSYCFNKLLSALEECEVNNKCNISSVK